MHSAATDFQHKEEEEEEIFKPRWVWEQNREIFLGEKEKKEGTSKLFNSSGTSVCEFSLLHSSSALEDSMLNSAFCLHQTDIWLLSLVRCL